MNLPNNSKGFTLIEVLISISIIGILTAGIVPTFSGYVKNQNLKQAQEDLKSNLRSVQNRALTGSYSDLELDGERILYWAIKFEDGFSTYDYFVSTAKDHCDLSNPNSRWEGRNTLPNDIKYFGNSGCLFFSIKNGDISKYPMSLNDYLDVKYSTTDTNYKRVRFNSSGLIYTISNE